MEDSQAGWCGVSGTDHGKTLQSLTTLRDPAAARPASMSPKHGPKAPTYFHGVHGQLVKRNLEPRLLSERLNWGAAAWEGSAEAVHPGSPGTCVSSLPLLHGCGMTVGLVCASCAVVAFTGGLCGGHLAVVLAHKYSKV